MTDNNTQYPSVFKPLHLGGHTTHNRICLTATLTNYATGSRVTPQWQHFLIERARGGTGLLVTEGIAVDPNAIANPSVVAGFSADNEQGFSDTANAVHESDTLLIAQLWHAGRQQLWSPTRSPQGVSDQPDAYSWSVPHVMDDVEIKRVISAFVEVAMRFQRCGFNGIELHGAHGYLITQFMSPWSNHRDDDWGGTRENRLRFCTEIASRIRAECGADFIVGLKLPADEAVEGGIGPDESREITQRLDQTGLFDYFAYSQGNFSRSLENHVPDHHFKPGHFVHLLQKIRGAAKKTPVMALGRVGTIAHAEQLISSGISDLVGMSRALISDAALVNKSKTNQTPTIRPCVFDNYPWGVIHTGKPMVEFHNPMLGQAGEADWIPTKANKLKKVAVIGAGPCGLEAAWISAARGHHVSLYGRSDEPGGGLRFVAATPDFQDMHEVINYQFNLCEQHGVDMHLGTTAQASDVNDADIILLCSGSELRKPPGKAFSDFTTLSARELISTIKKGTAPQGHTVVVYDMDHTAPTYGAVMTLTTRFERVVLITPRTHIAQNVDYCSSLGVFRRLYQHSVEIVVASEIADRNLDSITLTNVFSSQTTLINDVDLLVYSATRQVRAAPKGIDQSKVIQLGDCVSPRNLMIAIHEAHAMATQI